MTRVALLTREYPPAVYGGAGVHVAHLAPALSVQAGLDVEVHCFGPPRDDPLVAGAYESWDALAGEAPHLAALRTVAIDLAIAASVEGVDLVHSHTWYANLGGHVAKLLYDVPHVMTTHSLEPLRPWKREQLGGGYALSSFCEQVAIGGADVVVAVSEGMRRDVLGAYPDVDPDRIHVIHNGIDAEVYRPDPSTEIVERLGIDPRLPTVAFVGRVTRQKGLAHLLRAARLIPAGTQLVVCAGEPDTPEIAAEIAALVDELVAAGHRVVLLDRMLAPADVIQILTHATLLACPSVYEPFGLVNLEAMACETAVVATATGGIPEIVVEDETGLLVPPSSDEAIFAEAFAARMRELLTDPERAREMGRAGRRRVLDAFTWEVVADRTAAVYRRLVSGSGAALDTAG